MHELTISPLPHPTWLTPISFPRSQICLPDKSSGTTTPAAAKPTPGSRRSLPISRRSTPMTVRVSHFPHAHTSLRSLPLAFPLLAGLLPPIHPNPVELAAETGLAAVAAA